MKNVIYKILTFIDENKSVIHICLGAFIFLFFTLFRKQFSKIILKVVSKILYKSDETKSTSLYKSLHRPVAFLVMLLGLFIGVYINTQTPAVIHTFKILCILDICWGLINYLSDNLLFVLHIDDDNSKLNTTAIKFISNILRIIVIAFAIVMIISELGYNINGLIAGLGVGGLAVSLAAQDAVSNLISGFIIVTEKPFKDGDFIKTSSISGTVMEVTMRSTTLRTLDDSVVTIPNSNITNDKVINMSAITKRLIDMEFGVTYSTSEEQLRKCQKEIKEYLENNENILETPLRVNFSELDNSSLNFNVYCYTSIKDINEYNELISTINYKIKEIVERNGVEFAFPSTSVYIEKK